MRQPINLLTPHAKRRGMFWWTAFSVVVFFAGLGGWYVAQHLQDIRLKNRHIQTLSELQRVQAAVLTKKQALGLMDVQKQAAEMVRLQNQIDAQRDWADWLQKGELGRPSGPSVLLTTLARIHQEGLWLSRIELNQGGQTLVLGGSARHLEAVVQYAEALQPHLRDQVPFFALETTQEAVSSDGDEPSSLNLLQFKLY